MAAVVPVAEPMAAGSIVSKMQGVYVMPKSEEKGSSKLQPKQYLRSVF
jgi:hypothetical protein